MKCAALRLVRHGDSALRCPGYELGFRIGVGGMATVYYGRRTGAGGFAHAVALKHLHPHLAAEADVVTMFLDEARLAARIAHANVVSIVDVVQDGPDRWAIMPYVEGESLSRLVKASPRVRVSVALAIITDVLDGLHAAHAATDAFGEPLGIVHRDVSPQNILVGTDGAARILDFGVAKARGRLHQTRDGQVKGKMQYMAPEQLAGEATVATDVYATAVVLWELLAGRHLFDGESDVQILALALAGASSPPSAFADVPVALDAIVMRALSLDPADRFDSAAALARALRDAHPVATRGEVAAWVAEVGGAAIAERRALAVAMARSPEPIVAPSMPSQIVTERLEPGPISTVPPVVTLVMPRPSSPPASRQRGALVGVVAALFVLALVAFGARSLRAAQGATAQAPPATEPAVVVVSAAAAPTTEPMASPAPPPPVKALAPRRHPASVRTSAPAPAAPAPKPVTSATHVAPPPPSPPPPAPAASDDCDPPFVVDASGVRHYKRNCLR